MNTEKDEDRTISNFKLTGKEKKDIDMVVNGAFALIGVLLLLGVGIGANDIKNILGLLTFYIGVRFFPK
ncbi:MAG: hypothetical protein O8C61_05510 [Candidatus Methanoperedens sp.]|nr:hypothetical protein [Candidatus Methanoperedens sp.]